MLNQFYNCINRRYLYVQILCNIHYYHIPQQEINKYFILQKVKNLFIYVIRINNGILVFHYILYNNEINIYKNYLRCNLLKRKQQSNHQNLKILQLIQLQKSFSFLSQNQSYIIFVSSKNKKLRLSELNQLYNLLINLSTIRIQNLY